MEDFLGHLCSLRTILSTNDVCAESNYEKIFKFSVTLTNLHPKSNPLGSDESEWYHNYRKRMVAVSIDVQNKRSESLLLEKTKTETVSGISMSELMM